MSDDSLFLFQFLAVNYLLTSCSYYCHRSHCPRQMSPVTGRTAQIFPTFNGFMFNICKHHLGWQSISISYQYNFYISGLWGTKLQRKPRSAATAVVAAPVLTSPPASATRPVTPPSDTPRTPSTASSAYTSSRTPTPTYRVARERPRVSGMTMLSLYSPMRSWGWKKCFLK